MRRLSSIKSITMGMKATMTRILTGRQTSWDRVQARQLRGVIDGVGEQRQGWIGWQAVEAGGWWWWW